ncbi:MAG TPA: hypothetical protein VH596_08440 [Terriglobales bacterium]|jgi:hypothetical protein
MDRCTDHDDIRPGVAYVGDCYIWASIFYLDSSTDYRECLPRAVLHNPANDTLVMLGDRALPPTLPLGIAVLSLTLLLVVAVGACCYLFI